MRMVLLGMAQSGRRSLFQLLTGRTIPASRRPEETVEGVAPLRDPRLDQLHAVVPRPRKIYVENHVVLGPDMTPAKGGKRNWVEVARRADLLAFVIRAFHAPDVYHPQGSVDPERDRTALTSELLLADLELADTRLTRLAKEKRTGTPSVRAVEEAALQRGLAALEAGTPLSRLELTPQERAAIRSLDFLTFRPQLWIYNVEERDLARTFGPNSVTVSCRMEGEIQTLRDPTEREEYLRAIGLSHPSVDRVNRAAYTAMSLISFYTIGENEVRAWSVRRGATAPEAAGKVHTDMERGFIRAEVIHFEDFMRSGSVARAREKGLVAAKGKDYVVEDGDLCHFLFSRSSCVHRLAERPP